MTTLFISDLHLDPSRPEITDLFLRFLREQAPGADALYILGDLFEAWIGDDTPSPAADVVADALKVLSDSGVPVYSTFSASRSEEHTSELQSQSNLVCRLLLEKKK